MRTIGMCCDQEDFELGNRPVWTPPNIRINLTAASALRSLSVPGSRRSSAAGYAGR